MGAAGGQGLLTAFTPLAQTAAPSSHSRGQAWVAQTFSSLGYTRYVWQMANSMQ